MLRVDSVSKSYKDKVVLESVSLGLDKGEIVVLMGPNGSGKSTLLSIMSFSLKPDSGKVSVDELDMKASKKLIAYAPQTVTLFEELSVMDNLLAWSSFKGRDSRNRSKEKARSLVEELGMSDFRRKRIDKLSGGQKRRVNLAVTLMSDYDYLLLDEPFAGIDSAGEELIKNLILSEKKNGKGIIIAEHNKEIIEGAPALVVLTSIAMRSGYERDGSFTTSKGQGWEMFDAGIAAQTFCLAAHEAGVGSVILGIFDDTKVAELIGLPENQNVSALIPIGYSDKELPEVPRKAVAELLKFI